MGKAEILRGFEKKHAGPRKLVLSDVIVCSLVTPPKDQWCLGFNFLAFIQKKLIKNANATDKVKSWKSNHLTTNLSANGLYAWHI